MAKGWHHLFIVAFSRFLYTHVDGPREEGGEEEWAGSHRTEPSHSSQRNGPVCLHPSSLSLPFFPSHLPFVLLEGPSSFLGHPSPAWLDVCHEY